MPVSHLGLTVSHIPSATSFYLAALQPLGYRFIGESGDSIGLGVDQADFFLTQEPHGASISPTHIAFTANSRLDVRHCYAAALNAGAYPSGAPSFRNGECSAFNAAVEDLDGNVVEFIWTDPTEATNDPPAVEPSALEDSRVLSWQKRVAELGDAAEIASMTSRASRAKSRVDTAMDVASRASRTMRSASEAPSRSIRRARTEPIGDANEFPSKAFFGTLIGVAAAGAFCFAMAKTEQSNARDEMAFSSSYRSTQTFSQPADDFGSRRRNSVAEERPQSTRRNFSVTESAVSRRYPPRSMRAIKSSAYYDDAEVQDALSRYTSSRRPLATHRSRTVDAIDYTTPSDFARPTHQSRRPSERPTQRVLEYDVQSSSSRGSRRTSKRNPIDKPNYYIEDVPAVSTTSRQSRRRSVANDDADLKRRDSGVSMHSHRSRHISRHSSSHATRPPRQQTPSIYESAHENPISRSRSSRSHVSAAQIPIPESQAGRGYTDDESDGLGDMKTVVPDDSISCVDLLQRKATGSTSGQSRRSKEGTGRRRSEAESERTIRQDKVSRAGRRSAVTVTLPLRRGEERSEKHEGRGGERRKEGRKGAYSHA